MNYTAVRFVYIYYFLSNYLPTWFFVVVFCWFFLKQKEANGILYLFLFCLNW